MFEEGLADCWKMNFEEVGIALCRTLTEEPDLLNRVISSLESAVLDVPPPSKPHSITAPLRNGPRLDLHKVRFSGSLPLPKSTLKIKEAHSLEYPKSRPTSHSWLCLRGYGDFRIIAYLKPSGLHLNVPVLRTHSP